eukprot:TRINITY_DN554_c0_g1_i4.p1 TRINITY_DN554_c0_g1~~TRINITY_DN554_c0_g1_i4.p1  ORF type:complete len:503 (+),score=125.28 TRINITY_DN554_c0_g1_i4:164-1510(+)
MASVSLGSAFMMLTQTFTLSTLNCLNMVCSQAIGAGNKKLAGVWLQIGFLMYTVMIIPIFVVWWFFTDDALRAVGMDPDLSRDGQRYARYSIPVNYLIGIEYTMEQFYSALGVTKPAMVSAGISLILSVAFNLFFMAGLPGTSWDGMGFVGVALGGALAMLTQLIMFLSYTYYKGYHVEYWDGFSMTEVMQKSRIKEYFKLCVPTAAGALAEQGQFQLLTVFTAHLGSADIAAWSAMGSLWAQLAGASMGMAKAMNVRLATHLGSGDLELCFKSIKFGTIMISCISTTLGLSLYLARDYVGRIFSSDPEIIHAVKEVCWLFGIDIPLLNTGVVALFVLDAQGRPSLGAGIIGACTWLINIPFSALAVYKLGYSLNGIMFVVSCGYVVSVVLSWWFICRSDWDQLVIDAKRRSEREAEASAGSGSSDEESTSEASFQDVTDEEQLLIVS